MSCFSEQGIYLSKFILWCLDVKITSQIHSDWKCDNCPEMVNAITMTTLIATCQEEANEFNDTKIELVAEKMNNWSNVLHKNHFLIGMLRKRLFDLYRLYPAPETEVELRPFLQVRMHKSWYFGHFYLVQLLWIIPQKQSDWLQNSWNSNLKLVIRFSNDCIQRWK